MLSNLWNAAIRRMATRAAERRRFQQTPSFRDHDRRGSHVESLETRILPAVFTYVAAATADLTLSIQGPDYVVTESGVGVVASVPTATTDEIQIATPNSGNSRLTVDFTNGAPVPVNGLEYDGGAGAGDALVLTNGGGDSAQYTQNGPHAGDIELAAGLLMSLIHYQGVDSVTDQLIVDNRIFTFVGGSEQIDLSDGGVPGFTSIDSTLAETVTFGNPTQSLTINAGSDADTISIAGLGSGFQADLTIHGDADTDAVLVTSDLVFDGSLLLDVESTRVEADAITTTGTQHYVGSVGLAETAAFSGSTVTFDAPVDPVFGTGGPPTTVVFSGGQFIDRDNNSVLDDTYIEGGYRFQTRESANTLFTTTTNGRLRWSNSGSGIPVPPNLIDVDKFGAPFALTQLKVDPTSLGLPITLTANTGATFTIANGTQGSTVLLPASFSGITSFTMEGSGSGVFITLDDFVFASVPAVELTVNATIEARFDASIGGLFPFRSVTTGASGYTRLAGDVTVDGGAATIGNRLLLASDVVVDQIGAGDVVFVSSIDTLAGTSNELIVNTLGGVTRFQGAVGQDSLGALSDDAGVGAITTNSDGTTEFSGGVVIVQAAIDINDAATLLTTTSFTHDGPAELQAITGAGGLTKDGPGLMTLPGVMDFTGSTTIKDGLVNLIGTAVSDITVNTNGTLAGTGSTLGSVIGTGGVVSPGNGPGILTVGDLLPDSTTTIQIEVGGTTAGSLVDQIQVSGTVDLSGSHLSASTINGYVAAPLSQHLIIANTGANPVIGMFAGQPDGSLVVISGQEFRMFYNGGDGNDVVLLATLSPLVDVYVDDSWGAVAVGADPDGAGPALAFGVDSFASIPAGINAVNVAGRVHVNPGSYTGPVVVDKDVTITGVSGNSADVVISTGSGAANAINVTSTAQDVRIENLTVTDSCNGIDSVATGTLTLVNVTASDNVCDGLHAENAATIVVIQSRFENNDTDHDGNGSGVEVRNAGNLMMDGVLAGGNAQGVFVTRAGSVTDSDSQMTGNNDGGLVVQDLSGDVDLTRTVLLNNDVDMDNIGAGVAGNRISNVNAIGGDLRLHGIMASVMGLGTQRDGVSVDGVSGSVVIGDAVGPSASTVVNGNADDGISIQRVGGTLEIRNATVTNNDNNDGSGVGLFADAVGMVTVSGSRFDGNDGIGFRLNSATGVTIDTSTFNGNGDDGLRLRDGGAINVSSSQFSNNGGDGIQVGETGGLVSVLTIQTSNGTGNGAQGLNVTQSLTTNLQGGMWSGIVIHGTDTARLTISPVVATKDVDIVTQNETLVETVLDLQGNRAEIRAGQDGIGTLGFRMTGSAEIRTTSNSTSAVTIEVNTLPGGTASAQVATISAGTGGGVVRVGANRGAIIDVNSGVNVTAAGAVLVAQNGVGTAGDSIETHVSAIEGGGGAGGFFVDDQGGLMIGNVDLLTTGLATSTGKIRVTTAGQLVVVESVVSDADIELTALDTSGTGSNLIVRTLTTVQSTQGSVVLQAGDNLTLEDSSTVRADLVGRSVTLRGDFDSQDPGVGSIIGIYGTIMVAGVGTVSQVLGGPDGDQIIVAPGVFHTVDVLTLDGGGAGDRYEVHYGRLSGAGTAVLISDTGGGVDSAELIGLDAPEMYVATNNVANGLPQTGGVVTNVTVAETIAYSQTLEFVEIKADGGNDVIQLTPSQTAEMTVNGGDPVFGDFGVPSGDTLEITLSGSTLQVLPGTIVASGGDPDPWQPLNFVSIENLPVLPAGTSPAVSFDFDHSNTGSSVSLSPTQGGYVSVLRGTVIAQGLGYGWQSVGATAEPVLSFERDDSFYGGAFSDLIRDGHTFDAISTFTVDLANGWYSIDVSMGNPYTGIDGVQILDADAGGVLAAGISTQPGESGQWTLLVEVRDGTLDLAFVPSSEHPQMFSVNGLAIRPANVLTMGLILSGVGTLPADGVTVDVFRLTGAPADSLVTVSSTLGSIVSLDVDPELAGIQIKTDGNGEAEVSVRRPSGQSTAVFSFVDVNGHGQGFSTIDYVLTDVRNFDFNHVNSAASTGSSPTQAPVASPIAVSGFLGVLPTATYQPSTGFGWLAPPSSFDDGSFEVVTACSLIQGMAELSDLVRDGVRDSVARTLLVDLPDGDYQALVTIGDLRDHDGMQLEVDGNVIYSSLDTVAGGYVQIPFDFTVTGGQASFTFSDTAGIPFWVVNGLQIRPRASVSPFVFTPSVGAVSADGLTQVTITATTTIADGEEVTVSSSLGTIATADANLNLGGTQVVVSGSTINFDVVAPATPGIPELTVTSVDGAEHSTISAAAFLEFVISDVRRFDFNHTTSNGGSGPSPTAAGFIGVLRTDTDLSRGFGWLQSPNSGDAGVPNGDDDSLDNAFNVLTTDLYRDSNSGHLSLGSRTFRVQVDSAATYNGTVYVGSQQLDTSTLVSIEGVAVPQSLDSLAKSFVKLAYVGAADTNNDGFLDVTFSSSNVISPYWSALGIDVVKSGNPLPLPAPVVAAERGTGYSVDPITVGELGPVVEVAIAAWEHAGATAAELARLRTTQIVIRDLGANGALGLTTALSQVILDDDGAGLGWSLVLDKTTGDRYDLLTVIAHEFGHILGRHDLEPTGNSDELMSSYLLRGIRRDDLDGVDGFFDRAVFDEIHGLS